MPSIALIGADGAGKTTITRMLEESSLLPFRYLYMGINIKSSNVALPSSRLVERLKAYRHKKLSVSQSQNSPTDERNNFKRKSAGKLWSTARLANRLAEEWYRQLLSWYYQIRGYTVLYDRHFLFDFSGDIGDDESQPLTQRLHRWCLTYFYPRPNLVIYLDAPAEVLLARKGEATLQYLEYRRQAFIRQGKLTRNFVQVDATQPLDTVYAEVTKQVLQFYESHRE